MLNFSWYHFWVHAINKHFFCENFFIRYLASSPEYLREKRQNASDRWMWCGWLENKTRHYWSLSKVQHVCLALQQPWTFSNCRWKYLEATARWPTPNSRESSYLIGERKKKFNLCSEQVENVHQVWSKLIVFCINKLEIACDVIKHHFSDDVEMSNQCCQLFSQFLVKFVSTSQQNCN